MEKYEYEVKRFDPDKSNTDMVSQEKNALNELGEQGWNVFNIQRFPNNSVLFHAKRVKEPEAVKQVL